MKGDKFKFIVLLVKIVSALVFGRLHLSPYEISSIATCPEIISLSKLQKPHSLTSVTAIILKCSFLENLTHPSEDEVMTWLPKEMRILWNYLSHCKENIHMLLYESAIFCSLPMTTLYTFGKKNVNFLHVGGKTSKNMELTFSEPLISL